MPKRLKKALLIALCIILAHALVIMPAAACIIYESIFSMRFEPQSWQSFSDDDFPALECERSDFTSGDLSLAGYKYKTAASSPRGVVIIAHGLGGGGQAQYVPFANYFTAEGYYVFAYDATGNGCSEGSDAEGLPQGVIDLERAIRHVKSQPEYSDLPIMLFGHSWGAYSAGAVLASHPDIAACAMIAGFNESRDMLLYEASGYVGPIASLTLPYVTAYERLKFGSEYSSVSALDGMAATDARIVIVQSMDDVSVPPSCGYDKFYAEYSASERFTFITYTDRGHDRILYSRAAEEYRAELNRAYTEYVEGGGREYCAETKEEFMSLYLDKARCFEPDYELMASIRSVFDTAAQDYKKQTHQ